MSKPITKKATPKRKKEGSAKALASQLEVVVQARDHLAAKFGSKAVDVGSELDCAVPGYVTTGSLALDWIVGNSGVPQGRIIDVSGDEGVGKSTVADQLIASVQRLGGHAWLWDTENARDRRYQERLGVNVDALGKITSDTMEDGFEAMLAVLEWHNEHEPERPGIIAWDTPAGVPTRAEADPAKNNERFGPAKIIREHLRKIVQAIKKGRWILCIINQTYEGRTQGGMSYKAVYGGGGIPYFSSVRLSFGQGRSKIYRRETDRDLGVQPLAQVVKVWCPKNRVGFPHRGKQICIQYGVGISNSWEVEDVLTSAGAIEVRGSWKKFDPDYDPALAQIFDKSWQGNFLTFEAILLQTPGLFPEVIRVYKAIMADRTIDIEQGNERSIRDNQGVDYGAGSQLRGEPDSEIRGADPGLPGEV